MSPVADLSAARPASLRASLLACSALLFAILSACGGAGGAGGGDAVTAPVLVNTGPGSTGVPDVSGLYMRVNNGAASTCTPQYLPAGGGTVILEAFVDSQPVKIYQNGTRLTLAYVNYPQAPADTGTVDLSGKLSMGITGTGSKESLRGTRQFYVDLTGTFALTKPSADATTVRGTGNFTYVYHEDAATAPVYATCTRTIDISFRKTD
jgi:hypothetical protein